MSPRPLSADRYGFAPGGVSTSGGFGFGGRAVTPGAGRTSIGGGSGGTCWLTTGALEAGGELVPGVFGAAGAFAIGDPTGGRGALSLGFG